MIQRSPKTKVRRQMLFKLMKLNKSHPSTSLGNVSVEARKMLLVEFAEKIVPDKEILKIVCNTQLTLENQNAQIVDLLIKQRKMGKEKAIRLLQELLVERDESILKLMKPENFRKLLKRMGANTPEKIKLYERAVLHQIGTIENVLLKPLSKAQYTLQKS
ncbi:Uncharacterised protein [uncultured archaeon]|nr:Uncharacterised protein [uncultured archaeon]